MLSIDLSKQTPLPKAAIILVKGGLLKLLEYEIVTELLVMLSALLIELKLM